MGQNLYSAEICTNPDGPTLVSVTRRDAPLITVAIECPGGHARDPHDLPGLADLTAALLNEGPTDLSPMEWHRTLENHAIEMEIRPSVVRWLARFHCLSEELETAVGLFGEWLRNPALPSSEWKRISKSYRAGAREHWAQPIGVIDALSCVQVFGFGHPMAHPANEKSYGEASYEDARKMGAAALHRRPELFSLVGGDISAESGFDLLSKLISTLPDTDSPSPAEPQPDPAAERVWILDNEKLNQVYFALSRPGSRAGDPDRVALRIADYALGSGGFSSRLMKRVRSQMGHTYSISSSLSMDHVLGPFQIQSFTQTQNLSAMLSLIDEELQSVVEDGFSGEEVEDAKQHFYGALPLHLTSPEAILRAVADGLFAGTDVEQLEIDWQTIPALTVDEVNAAARRLIGDGDFRLAVIGPAAQIQPQVDHRGEASVFPFGTPPHRWQQS